MGSGGWVCKPDGLRGIKPSGDRRFVRLTFELMGGCNSKCNLLYIHPLSDAFIITLQYPNQAMILRHMSMPNSSYHLVTRHGNPKLDINPRRYLQLHQMPMCFGMRNFTGTSWKMIWCSFGNSVYPGVMIF